MVSLFSAYSGFLDILISIVAYVMALFVAMPFHEFAHAFAAKHEGDYTAVALKRYTLAPLSHIDVKGLIFLMLFRFGWAKPVPIDSRNFKRGKLSYFLVSIAGIVTNLLLGTIFMFIFYLIMKVAPEFYVSSLYGQLLAQFLILSVSLNFSLAFFNLLPIYPLDGYKVVESLSRWDSKFVDFLKKYSLVIYILIVFTGLYSLYYSYTAGAVITLLDKLFTRILGV